MWKPGSIGHTGSVALATCAEGFHNRGDGMHGRTGIINHSVNSTAAAAAAAAAPALKRSTVRADCREKNLQVDVHARASADLDRTSK